MRNILIAALLLGSSAGGPALSGMDHQGHGAMGIPAETRAQIEAVRTATLRYRDPAVAKAEGWEPAAVGGEDGALMGAHWSNEAVPEYEPGQALDLARPNILQYAKIGGRDVLVGVAYTMRLEPGAEPPEGFVGGADQWHLHDLDLIINKSLETRPVLRWLAEGWIESEFHDKGDYRTDLWMLHVWVGVDAPDGPFAMHNTALPYLRAGLPLDFAEPGGDEAAQGVNLTLPDGCDLALDGLLWIADANWRQSRAIHRVCEREAARVREVLPTGDAATINAAADVAWRVVDAALNATLDEAQRARIASLVHMPGEHPGKH